MKKKLAIFTLIAGVFLSGCGGSTTPLQTSFDASIDIAAIEDSMKVYQDLSTSAQSDGSLGNLMRIGGLTPSALEGVEVSTKRLLTNIENNWGSIGPGDSANGISREVLKEWGEAYLFWVIYQRKIQLIVEECLENPDSFYSCQSRNIGQVLQLDRQSTEPLIAVQTKIKAWQEKYANQ